MLTFYVLRFMSFFSRPLFYVLGQRYTEWLLSSGLSQTRYACKCTVAIQANKNIGILIFDLLMTFLSPSPPFLPPTPFLSCLVIRLFFFHSLSFPLLILLSFFLLSFVLTFFFSFFFFLFLIIQLANHVKTV